MVTTRSRRLTETSNASHEDGEDDAASLSSSSTIVEGAEPREGLSDDIAGDDLGSEAAREWTPFSGIHGDGDIHSVDHLPRLFAETPGTQLVANGPRGNGAGPSNSTGEAGEGNGGGLAFSDLVSDLGGSETDPDGLHIPMEAALTSTSAKLKIKLPPLSKSAKAKQRRTQPAQKQRTRIPNRPIMHNVTGTAVAKLKTHLIQVAKERHVRSAGGSSVGASSSSAPSSSATKRPRKSKAGQPDFEGVLNELHVYQSWASDDERDQPLSKRSKSSSHSGIGGNGRSRSTAGVPSSDSASLTQWSVLAYLEVEQPPQVVQKTARSQKKLEPQDPWRGGPVIITHKTTWPDLLEAIAKALSVQKENLVLDSLCWKIAPASDGRSLGAAALQRLPMTSNEGYQGFVRGGVQATGGTRNFIICMAPPLTDAPANPFPWESVQQKRSRISKRKAGTHSSNDSDSISSGNNSLSSPDSVDTQACSSKKGKKKMKAKAKAKATSKKPSLDQSLAPTIEKLKQKYHVGCCITHPGIRCFFYAPRKWHFELDNNHLAVWAHAINRGEDGVDFDNIPLGSKFFSEKFTLKIAPAHASNSVASQAGYTAGQPVPDIAAVNPVVSGAAGSMGMQSNFPTMSYPPPVFPGMYSSPFALGMSPFYPSMAAPPYSPAPPHMYLPYLPAPYSFPPSHMPRRPGPSQ